MEYAETIRADENFITQSIQIKRVEMVRLQLVREKQFLYGTERISKPELAVELVKPLFCGADREMMVQERIDMLLRGRKDEAMNQAFEQAEKVFAGLDEAGQEAVRCWQEKLCSREADEQRKLYLGGLRDGIRVLASVWSIGMEGVVLAEAVMRQI